MVNRVRSAIADSETGSQDEPPTSNIPVALTTPASTFAIQWHAPAYNSYWWPTFAELIQVSDANTAAVADVTALPAQTTVPTTYEVAPAKGHAWYTIHIAPGGQIPVNGIWPALLVNNEKPQAGKKWHLKAKTAVIIVNSQDGGVDVFTQPKRNSEPAKEALAFVDESGKPFFISGEFLTNHGNVVAFGPAALPKGARMDYRAVEQVFPLAQNPVTRIAKFGIPLAVSTATGFLAGGPMGVVVSDSIFATTVVIHRFQVSAAKKLVEPQQ
jgi:hypothetical protein